MMPLAASARWSKVVSAVPEDGTARSTTEQHYLARSATRRVQGGRRARERVTWPLAMVLTLSLGLTIR